MSRRKFLHTTFELVEFDQLICCLTLYEGEHSELNTHLTYQT
jgi:hypothetical protein